MTTPPRKRRPVRHLRHLLALLVLPVLLSGCTKYGLWPIDPASPVADHIDRVWTIVTVIGLGVLVLVGGLMLYAIVRFGHPRPLHQIDDEEPEQVHGNTRLEITWTFIPVLIVAVLFAVAVSTLQSNLPRNPLPANALRLQIVGYQWGWTYSFPQLPGLTVPGPSAPARLADLHLPTGRMIAVEVTSKDVVHDWWVPALDGHLDAYPGHTVRSWYMLRTPGQKYYVQCSKFCGQYHWLMHNYLVADSPAAFARWALAHGAQRGPLAKLLGLSPSGLALAATVRHA